MHVVILAGGSGTRLWPISRKGLPKHIVDFFPGGSLFSSAIKRAKALTGKSGHIVVVTGTEQERMLRHQAEMLGVGGNAHFIIEPLGKNTAPALISAGIFMKEMLRLRGPAVMLPADHMIASKQKFVSQFRNLGRFVKKYSGMMVIGIRPDFPSDSYGYIKASGEKQFDYGVVLVDKFTEKPSIKKARSFLKKGGYFWNSGMLVFDIDSMLDSSKRLNPGMFRLCREFVMEGNQSVYKRINGSSFDYAVLEKTQGIFMAKADFPWSDLGTWSAVEDVFEKDYDGNIIKGDKVYCKDVKNVSVFSRHKAIGLVSVKDMVVVDSNDALLICDKGKTEDVRYVVDLLKKAKDDSWFDPDRMERPWGYYVVLDRGDKYKTKRIVVYPGRSLSLQRHKHRSEHWVVLKGIAKVTKDGKEVIVKENESTYIAKGEMHKLSNPGKAPLEILEIQNGDYLGEDDIERFN